MVIYFFDPSYTTPTMLCALKKVLKIQYVFSLMREEDLSDEIHALHKTPEITHWEPSTEEKFDKAFKVIARKLFSIISSPVFDKDGNFQGYNGQAHSIEKNRPLYTIITHEEPTENITRFTDSNIMILRRRTFDLFRHIIPPQLPIGGIIGYLKVCLKNQDISKVCENSRFFKSTQGTLSMMDNVSIITLPSSFDKVVETNNSICSNIENPHFRTEHGFSRNPELEYQLGFLMKKGLTPPEFLILNEIKLADYISTSQKQRDFKFQSMSSNIKDLQDSLLHQYCIHLLSRELGITSKEVITKFLTSEGRNKYNNEQSIFEDAYRQDEEYRKECARFEYEKSQWNSYEKDLNDELDYIRNNGGDWIDD